MTFFVAWRGWQPLGCGALRLLGEGVGEVKRMYVVPEARGHGLGGRILARIEQLAADLGLQRLILETGNRQPEALALYRRTGWHPIPCYRPYDDDDVSVCLGKACDLPPGSEPRRARRAASWAATASGAGPRGALRRATAAAGSSSAGIAGDARAPGGPRPPPLASGPGADVLLCADEGARHARGRCGRARRPAPGPRRGRSPGAPEPAAPAAIRRGRTSASRPSPRPPGSATSSVSTASKTGSLSSCRSRL